jgi:hypothetical protein
MQFIWFARHIVVNGQVFTSLLFPRPPTISLYRIRFGFAPSDVTTSHSTGETTSQSTKPSKNDGKWLVISRHNTSPKSLDTPRGCGWRCGRGTSGRARSPLLIAHWLRSACSTGFGYRRARNPYQ